MQTDVGELHSVAVVERAFALMPSVPSRPVPLRCGKPSTMASQPFGSTTITARGNFRSVAGKYEITWQSTFPEMHGMVPLLSWLVRFPARLVAMIGAECLADLRGDAD